MKIGVLAPIAWRTPPLDYGGWELVASNLTEGLVRLGHEVTLFATADSQTTARLEAVCPQPLNHDRRLDARVYEALHTAHAFEMAQAGNFEVLHNHAGCFPLCFSRLLTTPVLTTLHGSAAENGSRAIYQNYADQPYVSISYSERELAPTLNYVANIYNGVDTEIFNPVIQEGKYLLVLGRMSPDKGIHLAIKVAHQTKMPLILAGIVPTENQLYFDEQIKPHLVEGVVDFVGAANHQLKNKLFGGAYALLHLVTYREAFGLTMIEAMACGTPVIGIRMGSIPEIIQPGLSGAIVPYNPDETGTVQAVCKALQEVGQLNRSLISRYAATNFGVAKMVQAYLDIYKEVIINRNLI
jgi:glycosyltransferase involved in cell wall biosynthesis